MARDLIAELELEGTVLNSKYINLCNFLDSRNVGKVDPQQIVLLREQKICMQEYLSILANRVMLLKRSK